MALGLLAALACCGCERAGSNVPQSTAAVVAYVALDGEFSEPILNEFTRRTGVAVECVYDVESTKTVGLTNRIREEAARPRCDVFWNNEIVNTLRLKAEGLLQPCTPANAADYPAEFRDPEGYWYGLAARGRIILVNTDLAKDGPAPQCVMDFADERWRGKLGIAKPLFGTTASHVACLRQTLGVHPFEEWLDGLKRCDVQIMSGNKGAAEAVGAGRLLAALTDTDDAIAEVDAKRPVRIVWPDAGEGGMGTLVLPNTLALIRGAPHPDAGKQLIDFLLSAEVEERLAEGPSAQMPLNSKATKHSRLGAVDGIRRMKIDFAATREQFEAAARDVEQRLLK
ncbi:MAG: extracellular solute-binding protein [Planctomycetes bacterium]|nr:extracellular solute-binding protein [Planctomycetota bacterium]